MAQTQAGPHGPGRVLGHETLTLPSQDLLPGGLWRRSRPGILGQGEPQMGDEEATVGQVQVPGPSPWLEAAPVWAGGGGEATRGRRHSQSPAAILGKGSVCTEARPTPRAARRQWADCSRNSRKDVSVEAGQLGPSLVPRRRGRYQGPGPSTQGRAGCGGTWPGLGRLRGSGRALGCRMTSPGMEGEGWRVGGITRDGGGGTGRAHHLTPPGCFVQGRGSQGGKGVIGHLSWAPSWSCPSRQVMSLPSLGTCKWRDTWQSRSSHCGWVGTRVLQIVNTGYCIPAQLSLGAQCLKARCPSGSHRVWPSVMPSMTLREPPPLPGRGPCSSAPTARAPCLTCLWGTVTSVSPTTWGLQRLTAPLLQPPCPSLS
ncbi:spidroin-2-like [Sapajus apella]|uniref:Spidroin-2-like n=1 Tax=Sapajus apella TaxID=9515 RepID=A0A6J3EY04_SAPAP|nr:spidroin-2-like [Sapajus apella]